MGRLKWKSVSQGVYDIECVTMNVRLIVLSKIPKSVNNELWRLFKPASESSFMDSSEISVSLDRRSLIETLQDLAVILSQLGVSQIKNQEQ